MSDIPVEIVSPELLECGEGPMWDPVRRQLYWTNATGQAIYRYDRRREEVGLLTEQVQAAGIALHEDGGLILGGGSGFLYWKGDEAIRVIADTCDGFSRLDVSLPSGSSPLGSSGSSGPSSHSCAARSGAVAGGFGRNRGAAASDAVEPLPYQSALRVRDT